MVIPTIFGSVKHFRQKRTKCLRFGRADKALGGRGSSAFM